MGRTFWWLATEMTEMTEKLLGDADSRRRCAGDGFERVESNHWWGTIAPGFRRIQSNYGQTEHGKNAWLATEVMVKILGDDNSRQRRGCEGWI